MEQGGIGERVGFDGFDLLVDFFAQIRVALLQHPRLELRETDVAAHVHFVGIFLRKLMGNVAVDYGVIDFASHHLQKQLLRTVTVFRLYMDSVANLTAQRLHTLTHRRIFHNPHCFPSQIELRLYRCAALRVFALHQHLLIQKHIVGK